MPDSQNDPKNVTLDSIDNLIDVPEVSEHAIAAQTVRDDKELEDLKLFDSGGNSFDASKHAVNSEKKPLITKLGRYRKISKNKNIPTNTNRSTVGLLTDKQPPTANYAAIGSVAATLTFTVGTVIGGDEWQPIIDKSTGDNERELLSTAYGEYFASTGLVDIPPGAALAVALLSYASRRFSMPKTQTRYNRLIKWLSGIFSKKLDDKDEKN